MQQETHSAQGVHGEQQSQTELLGQVGECLHLHIIIVKVVTVQGLLNSTCNPVKCIRIRLKGGGTSSLAENMSKVLKKLIFECMKSLQKINKNLIGSM